MSVDNARILVVGDVAAGKTSLIRYLATRKPVDEPPSATVGCELEIVLHRYEVPERGKNPLWPGSRNVERQRLESKDFCIELLEIGASHAHAVSRRMFYHDFSGIILVYDLTSPRSCQRLLFWRQEIQRYSFERQDVSGDGSYAYSRIPESVVAVGEERRSSTPQRVPVLVVGTKADKGGALGPEQRAWVDKILNDGAGYEIKVSTKRATDLSAGSKNLEVLNAFFNKVVEARFFSSSAALHTPTSPDLRSRSRSFNTRNKTAAM